MSIETSRVRPATPTVRVWLVRIAMFLAGAGFSCWLVIEGGQTRAGINAEAVGRVMTYMYLAAALVSLHAPLRLRWQDGLMLLGFGLGSISGLVDDYFGRRS